MIPEQLLIYPECFVTTAVTRATSIVNCNIKPHQSWTRIGFIHGLDWIGSICRRNCMDWTGLGQMTANCLESEIFRDSKLDWSNKLWLYFSFFGLLVNVRYCIRLLWLLFIVGYLINCTLDWQRKHFFLYCNRQCLRHCGYNGLDWMWVGIHMVSVDWIRSVS